MNHNSDTEMDLLLRRHGRRGGSAVARQASAAREDAVSRAHLDADEMSAYVEGALPEAARSLTSAHLTDCDACRKIVTGLALATSAEVEEKPEQAQTVSESRHSWRDWFAALFTPPVLRYAVPALALFTVLTIVGIVALRDRNRQDFVARKEEPQQQSTATRTDDKQGVTATTANSAPASPENHGSTTNVNAATGESKDTAEAPKPLARPNETATTTQPAPQDRAATTTGTTSADGPAASQPAAAPPAVARTEERQQSAPTMDGISPANDERARAKEKDDDKLAAQNKRESNEQERAAGGARSNYPATGRAARDAKQQSTNTAQFGAAKAASGADTTKNTPGVSAGATASRRGRRDSEGANEDSPAETRTVAGRTFRRQNGVWVDSAYSSSRSVTRVKRGSEQYRALAGDEPVVGTVASELGGDIIIVVRGRAYRIY